MPDGKKKNKNTTKSVTNKELSRDGETDHALFGVSDSSLVDLRVDF